MRKEVREIDRHTLNNNKIRIKQFGDRRREREDERYKNKDPHDDKETKRRRLKVPGTPVR